MIGKPASPDTPVDLDAHHRLARRAARESIVLLRNEGALLPLEGETLSAVAVIGAFTTEPRYQGAGSSQVVPARPVETIHDELAALIGPAGRVTYAAGYGADGATEPALLDEAREAARRARTAVVVVGLPASYEEEGADRRRLDLSPGHNALVETVLEAQPRTVVVLVNGSAVALPWAGWALAIVEGWLGGQASGGGIADVLLGRVNPSGKLAETFPVRLEETPSFLSFPDDGTGHVPFAEGLFTGYRWYDARRIDPLFPFGHGLSYTTFAYGDPRVDQSTAGQDGEERAVTVALTVRNTGTRAGREVVQLYVRERAPRLQRPDKELKAFAKVMLEPGEEAEVRSTLSARLRRVRPTGRRLGDHEPSLRPHGRRLLARHPRTSERDAGRGGGADGAAGAAEPVARLAGPSRDSRPPADGDRRPAAPVLRGGGRVADRGGRQWRRDPPIRGRHAHRQAGHVRRPERGGLGAPDRDGKRPRHRRRVCKRLIWGRGRSLRCSPVPGPTPGRARRPRPQKGPHPICHPDLLQTLDIDGAAACGE